jgi:hypothetical protein
MKILTRRTRKLLTMIYTTGLMTLMCSNVEVFGQDFPSEWIGQIVEDREKTRGYVEFVHTKFDPSSDEYRRAMLLYNNVMASYSGWVESVALAIERDKVKELNKSKDFKQRSTNAAEAAKQFVSYVEALPVKPTGKGLGVLTSLFDIGTKAADKIWEIRKKHFEGNKIKAEAEEAWRKLRVEYANSFREKAKWKTWNQLVNPAPTPSPVASPTATPSPKPTPSSKPER